MRGKVDSCAKVWALYRITPAHAGKSHKVRLQAAGRWDHPRTCGEKPHIGQRRFLQKGSPPHMRGKAAGITTRRDLPGITPAHAGKRKVCRAGAVNYQDHPRTCGEKAKYWMQGREPEGSPPHMRGKAERLTGCRFAHGITPAHAGKRQQGWTAGGGNRDHPRTCGEKSM